MKNSRRGGKEVGGSMVLLPVLYIPRWLGRTQVILGWRFQNPIDGSRKVTGGWSFNDKGERGCLWPGGPHVHLWNFAIDQVPRIMENQAAAAVASIWTVHLGVSYPQLLMCVRECREGLVFDLAVGFWSPAVPCVFTKRRS